MIKWVFTSPMSPACYSSAKRVLSEVRKRFPKVTLGQVEDVLQRIPSFTLHKPRRIRFKRLQTVPSGFMTHVQIDLADMQKIADVNDDFGYILVGADVLSRRIFATPAKTKGSS